MRSFFLGFMNWLKVLNLDWPNLLVGAVLGALVTGIISFFDRRRQPQQQARKVICRAEPLSGGGAPWCVRITNNSEHTIRGMTIAREWVDGLDPNKKVRREVTPLRSDPQGVRGYLDPGDAVDGPMYSRVQLHGQTVCTSWFDGTRYWSCNIVPYGIEGWDRPSRPKRESLKDQSRRRERFQQQS